MCGERGGGAWRGRVRACSGGGGRCARSPSVTVWPSVAGARPGLARVGRGARGAVRDGGAADGDGARTPLGGDESAEHHPRGRILVEPGGVPHRPLAAEPDRDGPRRRDTGGAGRAGHRGSEARVPVVRGPARGRPGGP